MSASRWRPTSRSSPAWPRYRPAPARCRRPSRSQGRRRRGGPALRPCGTAASMPWAPSCAPWPPSQRLAWRRPSLRPSLRSWTSVWPLPSFQLLDLRSDERRRCPPFAASGRYDHLVGQVQVGRSTSAILVSPSSFPSTNNRQSASANRESASGLAWVTTKICDRDAAPATSRASGASKS